MKEIYLWIGEDTTGRQFALGADVGGGKFLAGAETLEDAEKFQDLAARYVAKKSVTAKLVKCQVQEPIRIIAP